MSFAEIAALSALGLALALGGLCLVLSSRLSAVERQYRALMRGSSGTGAQSLSLGELVSGQGERLELTRAKYERLRLDLLALAERHGAHAQRRIVAGAEPAEPTTVETPRLS